MRVHWRRRWGRSAARSLTTPLFAWVNSGLRVQTQLCRSGLAH
jgi:hypothetical protein